MRAWIATGRDGMPPPDAFAHDADPDALPASVCRQLDALQFHERASDDQGARLVAVYAGRGVYVQDLPAAVQRTHNLRDEQAAHVAPYIRAVLRERRKAAHAPWALTW